MRINRYVALSSGLSRRAADQAVSDGRVTIYERPALLGDIAPSHASVRLDGKLLALPKAFMYVALNKPVGYVSSRQKQGSDPTIYELLPEALHKLKLAGRLDRDSSGLVLLSDDGSFVYDMSHPSADKTKQYDLVLSKPASVRDLDKLTTGVSLSDGPSRIKVVSRSGKKITVTLSEGRNRQIRRTFGSLGYDVMSLHRTRIGQFSLGGLPDGEWRELDPSRTSA